MGPRLCAPLCMLMLSLALTACKTQSPNRPPDTPDLVSSETVVTPDSAVVFSAVAEDPDDDAVSFRFSWGDGDTSDWSFWTASGDTRTMTHAWTDTGIYQVTAQARDDKEELSAWSRPCSLAVRRTVTGRIRWQADAHGRVDAPPAVGPDGNVYCANRHGEVVALSPDGDELWVRDHPHYERTALSIGPDTTLYLPGGLAVGRNGQLKWSIDTLFDLRSMPALGSDGTIHFGEVAVHPDGSTKWSYEEAEVATDLAIAADGTVYLGARRGYDTTLLVALDPDGSVKWQTEVNSSFTSPAVGPDGTIYVGVGWEDGGLYAFDAGGSLRWRFLHESSTRHPAVVGPDGTVYYAVGDGLMFALSSDGQLKWRYGVRSSIRGAPAVASDGTVYLGESDGILHAINADGTRKWTCETDLLIMTALTLGPDGTIYLGAYGDLVVAVGGDVSPSPSGWPMLGHDPQHTCRSGN